MIDLWFDIPAGQAWSPPTPVRTEGSAVASRGPEVWVVDVTRLPPDITGDRMTVELPGALGAAVEGAAYVAHRAGAELPPALLAWGTARDVPAAEIAPGRPTVVHLSGAPRLALAWDYGPLTATVTITASGDTVCAIAPTGVAPVRLAPLA